jgi:hypothetical protein
MACIFICSKNKSRQLLPCGCAKLSLFSFCKLTLKLAVEAELITQRWPVKELIAQSWPVKEQRACHFRNVVYASALNCIDSLCCFIWKKILCCFIKQPRLSFPSCNHFQIGGGVDNSVLWLSFAQQQCSLWENCDSAEKSESISRASRSW